MSQELQYSNPQKNTLSFASLRYILRRLRRFLQPSGFSFNKPWKNQTAAISHYWTIYGGFKALILSPYIHLSALLTIICYEFWAPKITASEIAVGVLPNLLGFTVGALAIVLAFSSAPVFETLAEKGNPQSFFMKLTASLIHFILAQVIALVAAIVGRITESPSLDVLALFLLFYAVMVTFAAGLQLFLTAVIYNAKASMGNKPKSTDES
jgi:hypothetical protein